MKQRLPFILSKELVVNNQKGDDRIKVSLKNSFVKCHKELER